MSTFARVDNPVFETYVRTDGDTQLITIIQANADEDGTPLTINDEPAVIMMTRDAFKDLLFIVQNQIGPDGLFTSMEFPNGRH